MTRLARIYNALTHRSTYGVGQNREFRGSGRRAGTYPGADRQRLPPGDRHLQGARSRGAKAVCLGRAVRWGVEGLWCRGRAAGSENPPS